ncbi:aminotransferase class IV [Sunxiuqinia sp. A32]|uniref:aminotransferase class IV n=1 Tax=Sunxiuqinia sp. A32 TaxID=3461496 RepID=UPI00404676F1
MCLLLETIKLENGVLANLQYHEFRFNDARKRLFNASPISLAQNIHIPQKALSGLFRCRITYSEKIENIEFIPHQPRKIESFKIVSDNSIDYSFKYADRSHLQKLYDQREDCDEIIIVKNNLVTDSFTGNLVFFDGEKWLTPKQPLLKGTQRQFLLDSGKIFEASINENQLKNFEKIGMINVFYTLNNMPVVKNTAINH